MAAAACQSRREKYPSLGYIAPFAAVLLLIALPKPPSAIYWEWPARVLVVVAVCYLTWPTGASLLPHRWLASTAIGTLVFVLWIAPELIYPQYRHSVFFSNALLGRVGSSLSAAAIKSNSVLFWRTVRAATVVPIAEELFWRAWFMRWFTNHDFQKIPLGTYVPSAFFVTAVLFGLEHGPYWDVGLGTGLIYNFWMIRTKSLGDCVLMHAVTNLLLSLYVIAYGQWQYWQ